MILFNKPSIVGKELEYLNDAILNNSKISGNGLYTERCQKWLENHFKVKKTLLTTSCTHALEMAAILINIQPGDEVIMPSYTFVSTANAFVLRGAKVVFVDIRPDTMNINETLIEDAITEKTKAIVPVHYAGIPCEMDKIMEIANSYNLYVIEDAAQAVMSTYKGKALGSIGDLGCFSFHETKNYSMGEGGALLINNDRFFERAEIIREKGTNRSKFIRGQVDKYTWVDIGSSYVPSELNAAYLYAQLEEANKVNVFRLKCWQAYYEGLKDIEEKGSIELPKLTNQGSHNGHIFYIKCKTKKERSNLISYLNRKKIQTTFHFVPLHSANAGLQYSRFFGEDVYTTYESERLLRLPLYYSLKLEHIEYIIKQINEYYSH
ncbi:dTDP-4-amino-4,6-dideoxygalactose transaminase [Gracilibacillus xinjiangensis]|uniref:dTDP-4-amino-4,6-dideoxygalactose transaminase n=1 Tax=Gracilibacillus xinjiangensis TaxID=1193282 RepID=A0ABV8WWV6_9BACI